MKSLKTASTVQPEAVLSEFRLRNERIELSVVPEFGLHWTSLRTSVKGQWIDLLHPVPSHAELLQTPTGYGCYTMAPWSNRVAQASFEFRGKRSPLRVNFADGTAIHGDVRTRPWKVVSCEPDRIEANLDARDFHDFNFPFALKFRETLELFPEGLRASVWIENVDRVPAPVGLGFHPFFKRRLTDRDRDVILHFPAGKVYPARDCIPTGPAIATSGRTDLSELRLLGNPGLDDCFTDFDPDSIRVFYPGTGVQLRYRLSPVFTHAVIYAPNDSSGAPRDFVAIEPTTHVNDGFNCLARGGTDTGVKVLEAGETWGGSWDLSVADI